ncbi:hypothetical protein P5641_23135 [Bacillus subtilis]
MPESKRRHKKLIRLFFSSTGIAEVYVALLSSFEGKAKEALVQRLNENATMLTNATENRSVFLRSIKTK